MADAEEVRMLAEITRLYYEEEWTQQRIAKKFNMSRSLVSKLLSKARKIGIVEIIIHDEEFHPYRKLEEELKKRFQIREAVCVSVENSENPVKTVGAAAAKYVARKLSTVKYVAMTAGTTTRQIAESFSSGVPFDHVTFVPMSGGLGEERWEIQANVVCERMAKNSGGNSLQLHAPIVLDSYEAKEMLLKQHFIKSVMEKDRNAELAVVGLGSSPQYFELTESYLHGINREKDDISRRLVGDISYNYFDKEGELIDCKWNRQLISLNIEEIKRIPEVIAVTEGTEKAASLYAALKHKIVDGLVTDVHSSRELIEIDRRRLMGKEN